MEFFKEILSNLPTTLASVALIVVFVISPRKGKGYGLMIAGAVLMLVLNLFQPVLRLIIMPLVVGGVDPSSTREILFVVSLVMNIIWSFPVLFIAAGFYRINAGSRALYWD
ncbi:MAG: hypothetical protein AAF492_15240 [Verrucomicrobiota bacterium]